MALDDVPLVAPSYPTGKPLPAPLRADFSLTRYQASALLTFQFNKTAIQRLVTAANDAVMTELREVA